MKLLFKQRFFSWFDSYDIYDESGNSYFTVNGKLSWGHLFVVSDRNGKHVGTLKEQVFRFLPHFNIYIGEQLIGEIVKEFSFFRPKFSMSFNDWEINGNWMEWDYEIRSKSKGLIATISKELFHFTDHYVLNIVDVGNALNVLMITLAIDAIKCHRS